MSIREILEAYFLSHKKSAWEKIPKDQKAKLLPYILTICTQKHLSKAIKALVSAQRIPKGVEWADHLSMILDMSRPVFTTKKKSLYKIPWFFYPKKITPKEDNIEAIEYGLNCQGRVFDLKEVLNSDHCDGFVKHCVTEYKKIQKILKK